MEGLVMVSSIERQELADRLAEFGMVEHIADDVLHRSHHDRGVEHRLMFQGQGKILLTLSHEDGLSQKELSTRLNLTPQSTAEFIGKLSRKNFISKERSEVDKRVYIVKLTDEGREEVQKMAGSAPEFLNVLNDEETKQFTHILGKLAGALRDEIEDADPSWTKRLHQMLLTFVTSREHYGEDHSHRH